MLIEIDSPHEPVEVEVGEGVSVFEFGDEEVEIKAGEEAVAVDIRRAVSLLACWSRWVEYVDVPSGAGVEVWVEVRARAGGDEEVSGGQPHSGDSVSATQMREPSGRYTTRTLPPVRTWMRPVLENCRSSMLTRLV